MPIKIDGLFRGCYKREGFTRSNAHIYCSDVLVAYDYDTLSSAFNILKVGDVINSDYITVAEKIFKALPEMALSRGSSSIIKSPSEILKQKRQDIIALALIYFQKTRHPDINKYIKPKRNIEFEVTANLYGEDVERYYEYENDYSLKSSNINSMVSKMKEVGLPGYNVEEAPNVSWDHHYFNICLQVSRNSKCLSRKIGAILVEDKRIISSGYNGPPEGIPSCDCRWFMDEQYAEDYKHVNFTKDNWKDFKGQCPRKVLGFKSGEGLDICPAVHAEANTIINCARKGFVSKGAIMYMSCGIPCMNCMKELINAGIKELVITKFSYYDKTSKYLLENSEVKVRLYDFIDKSDLYNF